MLLGSRGDCLFNEDLDPPELARCREVWILVDLARLNLLAKETCMMI